MPFLVTQNERHVGEELTTTLLRCAIPVVCLNYMVR